MKILFIARIYPNKYSDDGRVIHSQAMELIKKGVEVKVISPLPIVPKFISHKKSLWRQYRKITFIEKNESVEVYHPKYVKVPDKITNGFIKKISEFSFINTILNTIEKNLKEFDFDVVHIHMTYLDGVVLHKLKRNYDVPVIVSSRRSDFSKSKDSHRIHKLTKNIYSEANQIIVPSIPLKNKLKNHFNYTGKYVGNGIYTKDMDNVTINDNDIDFIDNFVILSVSNLISLKGIDDNLRAISLLKKKIPNILYLIVGDGPEKKYLRKLADSLDINKNVKFLGGLEHKNAMYYMKRCDVFSLPSKKETFGLVYLEALYYNKPIILCEEEGIAGSVKHNEEAILVPKNSPSSIAKYISKLYLDLNYRKQISIKGNEFVSNSHTWDKIGDELLMEYNKTVLNYNNSKKN